MIKNSLKFTPITRILVLVNPLRCHPISSSCCIMVKTLFLHESLDEIYSKWRPLSMWVGQHRFFRTNRFWKDRNWATFINEPRSEWANRFLEDRNWTAFINELRSGQTGLELVSGTTLRIPVYSKNLKYRIPIYRSCFRTSKVHTFVKFIVTCLRSKK